MANVKLLGSILRSLLGSCLAIAFGCLALRGLIPGVPDAISIGVVMAGLYGLHVRGVSTAATNFLTGQTTPHA